jgi:TPR repeat protein
MDVSTINSTTSYRYVEALDNEYALNDEIDFSSEENELLISALELENKNDFKGAMTIYVFLFEQDSPKVKDQFLLLKERGGVEQVYNYCKQQEKSVGVLVCLGLMNLHGLGVTQDFTQARFYFNQAAGQWNSTAITFLGTIYFNGVGVKPDYARAHHYFEIAAELDNATAFNNLGIMYFNGVGVARSYFQARRNFKEAAERGHADAYNRLGAIYFVGSLFGVEKSLSKALYLFSQAEDKGHAGALDNLGNMYTWGCGVERDVDKAEDYYRQARERRASEVKFKSNEFVITEDQIRNMRLNGGRQDQIDSLY